MAAFLLACLGDPVGPSRTLIIRMTGPTLAVGAPGTPLPEPVMVQAVGGSGEPVPGAKVEWRVKGRGAEVARASAITDANGEASAQWVLGTVARDTQGLSV